MTKYLGFKPYYHQSAVINELKNSKGTGKVVICKSSRQKGKTFMVANLLLYFSINYKNTKNFCLSPTLKQAKSIYKTVLDAIVNSGIVKRKNSTELSIELINGSIISFKSAEQRNSLRGYTVDFLCIDECAFISDEIFYLVLPWIDAKKASMLLVSTPFIKTGFFWNYFNYGLNKERNCVTVDWSSEEYQESIRKILPLEKLLEYEKMLPSNVFKTEYLGEWLDDEGTVFTNFKECIKDNYIKPTDKLIIGLDWGAGNYGDYTVMSVLNDKGEQVYLDCFNNLSTTKQLDRIERFITQYMKQIVVIGTELNSIGTPLTDILKSKSQFSTIQNKFKGYITTNKSKNDWVQNLQVAFERKEVSILNNQKQINELGYYTATYNPKTKMVSYNAPIGLHDDTCIALMLSYAAYKENNTFGKYNIR